MAEVILATQTTPAAPSAGNLGVFADSADGYLKQIDSAGNVRPNVGGLPLALTGATAAARFVGGTVAGAPVAGTFAVGDMVVSQAGQILICTVAGSPGTWVAVAGGAMAQIADSTRGTDGTFDFTGIAGTYNHLQVICYLRSDRANTTDSLAITFNNDTGANYYDQQVIGTSTTAAAAAETAQTSLNGGDITGNNATANLFSSVILWIPNYANTSGLKAAVWQAGTNRGTAAGDLVAEAWGGWYNSTSAISRITLKPRGGGTNFKTGSRVTVYGLT